MSICRYTTLEEICRSSVVTSLRMKRRAGCFVILRNKETTRMSINKKCALMFGVAPVALLLLAAGCNKGADSSAPPAPPGGPVAGPAPAASGQASTGKDLLTANCRCHNGGGGRAPDLSHEGARSDK